MAIPTIGTLTPALGFIGGGNLIEITGTNFRTWEIPPPNGQKAGPVWPTVRVRFGGLPGTDVMVVSSTKLFVRPPRTPLSVKTSTEHGEGLVSVEVANLDADGAVVAGEVATAANAYRYRRAQLGVEADLTRLCRALLQELKAQVIVNVSLSTHTDYDPTAGDELNVTGLAELPGIALLGPELVENRQYSTNEPQVIPISGGISSIRRAPKTVDVIFNLVGLTNDTIQAINLMQLVVNFFDRNHSILLLVDPANPSKGFNEYPLAVLAEGDPKMDVSPDDSNLRVFSARFRIIGFDIDDIASLPGSFEISRTAQVVESIGLTIERKADT